MFRKIVKILPNYYVHVLDQVRNKETIYVLLVPSTFPVPPSLFLSLSLSLEY